MTEVEVIKNINALNAVCGQKDFYNEEFVEALKMGVDALEKQIAKKIISPLKIENVIGGYCPTCNGTVSIAETWLVKTKGQHCTWCGQKLKWQDSEV